MGRMIALLFVLTGSLAAQETVIQYFSRISKDFSLVRDYVATWKIEVNGEKQLATVYYRAPDQILMKYSQPAGRFVLIQANEVVIYNRRNNIVLRQMLDEDTPVIVGSRSLSLFQNNYQMRFEYAEGATPRKIEGISGRVVALLMTPKNAAFGTGELEVLFDSDNNMIRRLSGHWYGQQVIYNFTEISLNQNLEDGIFEYPLPSGGKEWNNFLQG